MTISRALLALLLLITSVGGCNAIRVLVPSRDFDSELPALPDALASPALLFFSKTNGFRHEEAIPASRDLFREIATRRGWGFYATENGAIHAPELLRRFSVVVWSSTSGDVLDDSQKAALRDWIEEGGGFVGIHGAGGDPNYAWDWYVETLIGAQFTGHPMNPHFQQATMRVEDRDHPATRHLPATWPRVDEWYSFEQSARSKGARILVSLDESTYEPRLRMFWMDRDLSMGEDHPLVWSHCVGRGRAIYSALGHLGEAYAEPNHVQFLEEAAAWAIDDSSGPCEASAEPR